MEDRLYFYKAKILKVVDGDTIDVQVDLGFKIYHNIRLRLLGIDTPEIYGRHAKTEKELGLKFKEYVESLLPVGTEVFIKTYKDKTGKYGRYLADIILTDNTSLIEKLLEYANSLGIDIKYNRG